MARADAEVARHHSEAEGHAGELAAAKQSQAALHERVRLLTADLEEAHTGISRLRVIPRIIVLRL